MYTGNLGWAIYPFIEGVPELFCVISETPRANIFVLSGLGSRLMHEIRLKAIVFKKINRSNIQKIYCDSSGRPVSKAFGFRSR